MKRYLILALLFFGAGVSTSQAQDLDTPGTQDHPLITRYEGSILDGYEFHEYSQYVLPLGPAVQVAGVRVPSMSDTLEGKVTRILYRGPENRSTLEILRNYQIALSEKGFESVYECAGDACGRLFHWLLYKDEKQIRNTKTSGNAFDSPKDIRYLAVRKTSADGAVTTVSLLVAVDAIWTKKPVTLVEIIEKEPMDTGMVAVNADAMAEGLDETGHIAIYGIYFDTGSDRIKEGSDETLTEISKLLASDPSLNLLVVGHTDSEGGYDFNIDLSRRRAASVVNALVERFGVDSGRLTDAGVGYLAPVETNDTEEGRAKNRRVELVKH